LMQDHRRRRKKINWYPGHIAKAQRQLLEYIRLVDVVIEVRDARIPLATGHPMVPLWVGNRPRIIVLNRCDLVAKEALQDWERYLKVSAARDSRIHNSTNGGGASPLPAVPVVPVNAREGGRGIPRIQKALVKVGEAVNAKRERKGLRPRAVRALVIGYPNVGKSALINRLIGRKKTKSYNMPGVTRQISWVRLRDRETTGPVEKQVELLDTPGIIPANQEDQSAAWRLAMCNDISQAAYDVHEAGVALVDELLQAWKRRPSYVPVENLRRRYGVDPHYWGTDSANATGEFYMNQLAFKCFSGDINSAAGRLLSDFQKGRLGKVTLEIPPPLPRRPPQHDTPTEAADETPAEPKMAVPIASEDNLSERSARLEELRAAVVPGQGGLDGW